MEREPPVLGAILAGGLARRMGGGDKCLLDIGGRPILAHIAERLAPQCERLVLNANGDPARFAAFSLPVVPDGVPGSAGPLAGLLAVLEVSECDEVVTVPGDTPFVPHDLVARLRAARAAAGAVLACAASGGRLHPTIGLWPVSMAEDLRGALSGGERAVGRFASRYPVAVAEWSDEPDPFFNVNEPADLARASARSHAAS